MKRKYEDLAKTLAERPTTPAPANTASQEKIEGEFLIEKNKNASLESYQHVIKIFNGTDRLHQQPKK